MSRDRMRQDEEFWQIVKDLRWKLDDRIGGSFPVGEPEFDHGRRRARRGPWTVAFLAVGLGFLTFMAALTAPPVTVAAAAGVLVTLATLSALRR